MWISQGDEVCVIRSRKNGIISLPQGQTTSPRPSQGTRTVLWLLTVDLSLFNTNSNALALEDFLHTKHKAHLFMHKVFTPFYLWIEMVGLLKLCSWPLDIFGCWTVSKTQHWHLGGKTLPPSSSSNATRHTLGCLKAKEFYLHENKKKYSTASSFRLQAMPQIMVPKPRSSRSFQSYQMILFER